MRSDFLRTVKLDPSHGVNMYERARLRPPTSVRMCSTRLPKRVEIIPDRRLRRSR